MPNGTVHVALQQPSVLVPISEFMGRYPITPPILNASGLTLTRGYSSFRQRPLKVHIHLPNSVGAVARDPLPYTLHGCGELS